jgi:hypothetical protein
LVSPREAIRKRHAGLIRNPNGYGQPGTAGKGPEFAKHLVTEAAMNVVRAEADTAALLRRFEAAYREFADARRALGWFETERIITDAPLKSYDREPRRPDLPGAQAWKDALAALENDADAELPRLG